MSTAASPSFADPKQIQAIDRMVQRVHEFKVEGPFTREIERRQQLAADFTRRDNDILGRMVALIAYSNNARASKVQDLEDGGVFRRIFRDYSVADVADLNAQEVIEQHWHEVTAIRFRRKIGAMIACAKYLSAMKQQHVSFMRYLSKLGLPLRIETQEDILTFWRSFDEIRSHLKSMGIPYFANFTSLCHLLMDLGLDCAKPDNAVMKAAVDLGVVGHPGKLKNNPGKDRMHPEHDLRATVQSIQAYALYSGMRAPVVDLYFLIHGGQSGVKALIRRKYYA